MITAPCMKMFQWFSANIKAHSHWIGCFTIYRLIPVSVVDPCHIFTPFSFTKNCLLEVIHRKFCSNVISWTTCSYGRNNWATSSRLLIKTPVISSFNCSVVETISRMSISNIRTQFIITMGPTWRTNHCIKRIVETQRKLISEFIDSVSSILFFQRFCSIDF